MLYDHSHMPLHYPRHKAKEKKIKLKKLDQRKKIKIKYQSLSIL